MTLIDRSNINSESVIWWFVAILISELLFIIYLTDYFTVNGYAAPPFFFAPIDTFMDFFNTNYWSLNDGRYDFWQSIYPISVFALAQLLVPDYCVSVLSSLELRDCAPYSVGWLFLFYVIAIFICTKLILKHVNEKKIWLEGIIFLSLLLQFPGLFALERGNYIVVALLFLSFSRLFGVNWKGAIFLAMAINIKQYLIVLWLVPLFKKEYIYFLMSVTAALLINQLSMAVLGDNNYRNIFGNMFSFSGALNSDFFQKVWYTTSLSSWSKAVFHYQDIIPVTIYFSAHLLRWVVFLLAAYILMFTFLKARLFCWDKMNVVILLCMMVASDLAGGYAIVLLLPYLNVIIIGSGRIKYSRAMMLILLMPLDFLVGPMMDFTQFSFLSQQNVVVSTGLTFGAYIRPFLLVFILIILSYPVLTSLRKLQ
jgi:hypothetical protein